MKRLFLFSVVFLAACSSTPTIKGYDGPKALSRDDVIQGARSCINAKLKPEVVTLPQKTSNGTVLVPVDVNCTVYK